MFLREYSIVVGDLLEALFLVSACSVSSAGDYCGQAHWEYRDEERDADDVSEWAGFHFDSGELKMRFARNDRESVQRMYRGSVRLARLVH